MTVLVVEDSDIISSMIEEVLSDEGFNCELVSSGEEALTYCQRAELLPAVAILDIGLPGMDGYETGQRIKDLAINRHLPIIFLTGSQDVGVLKKCLSIGDDYVAKPFDIDTLVAKVSVHHRIGHLYQDLSFKYEELEGYQRRVLLEHDIVETIFTNHFERHISASKNFHYHISPKSVFNGDVLLAAIGPSGNLYVAVGDVTGHGLPAAVGAIPVYSTFRAMAEKGMSIGLIAAEMNRSLRELLPDNMMLAAHLLELSGAGDRLTIWSGGMPAMVLADDHGNIQQLIEGRHCPLAMLEADEFSQDVQVINVEQNDRIYLYTDGVEESRNSSGEMFGEDRIYKLFNGQNSDMFNYVIDALHSFVGEQEQDDDITLVELRCIPLDGEAGVRKKTSQIKPIPWSLHFDLGSAELKASSPVSQIVRLLSNAMGIDVHQDYISTVLSELFSNALEHGLLALDSSMKQDEDGFIEYYSLRQQRLENLNDGRISITINLSQLERNTQVEIIVKDSGQGFDFNGMNEACDEESFGRGVKILHDLCDSIEYSDNGSRVKAVYTIGS